MAGEFGGEWIHIHAWLTPFLFMSNNYNIANQLYANIKLKAFLKINKKSVFAN